MQRELLWHGIDRVADERTKDALIALTQAKHSRMAKALEIAKEAAWRDLPTNEQSRYFEWAYQAIKAEERTN